MSLTIQAFGTMTPKTVLRLEESRELARFLCAQSDAHVTWLPSMYNNTGIRERHFAFDPGLFEGIFSGKTQPRPAAPQADDPAPSYSYFLPTGEPGDRGPTTATRLRFYREEAPPLALGASTRALAKADVAPRDITHLITVSCTGFFAPGIDSLLIEGLGLSPTVLRTQVGFMGCHGALNGLRVAQAFAEADPKARVLLCAVELCSLHYHYGWHPQQIIANALFADGAAALVGVPSIQPNCGHWRLVATGSCIIPNSADAMTWTIADHGFEMTLARSVPTLINKNLRPWLTGWLASHGVALEDVRSWAVHPGGPHILTAVEECLELPPEALAVSRSVFADFGNMSSPTTLFILDRLRARGANGPCVALGFGPGLAAEAALLDA